MTMHDGGAPGAGAACASLLYASMLAPLASAFGDVGGLVLQALAEVPLHSPADPLATRFSVLLADEQRS